jgi:hypothetical protein
MMDAKGQRREAGSEGSMDQTCESMNKNRILGARRLSPEQEAAEQKALSEAAMDFRPALPEALAQAKKAPEELGGMTRCAAGKWINDGRRDITGQAVTFNNLLALCPGLFEPLSPARVCRPFPSVAETI